MLNKEPEKRITLAEIVDHPWLISHEECVLPLHFRPSVRLSPPDPLTVVKQKVSAKVIMIEEREPDYSQTLIYY